MSDPAPHPGGPPGAEPDVVLDGTHLHPAGVAAVATRRARARLAPAARDRIAAAARYADAAAAARPIYGRTTGVGANRTVAVTDPQTQAMALLRSHATSAGAPRSRERVRALLAVRLNQLAAGGSGVHPRIADALAGLLADDTLPPVRELGGIGTGDLPALALTALALAGEAGTEPPARHRAAFGIGDALAFVSSNAGALGDAALAGAGLRSLAGSALAVAALSHAAVDGNPEAYAPPVERATPFPGARRVCATMRAHLGEGTARPARIQDPYGLRALPQVHGALLDRLDELDAVVTTMINAPSENPVLLPDVGVAHHSAFHAAYLAQALDAARSALAQAAGLGLSRLGLLTEPEFTGLGPFLGDGRPGASGVMMVEYVAAGALARLRAAAQPYAVQSVTLSRGVEEDASFAAQGAAAALAGLADYRTVIACELVAAVRCLRMRSGPGPAGLAALLARCAALPDGVTDRDLTADIEAAEALLADQSGGRSSSA